MTTIQFTGTTTVPEPAAQLLDKAKDWGMDRCVVIGFTPEGHFRIGANFSDGAEMLALLEIARFQHVRILTLQADDGT